MTSIESRIRKPRPARSWRLPARAKALFILAAAGCLLGLAGCMQQDTSSLSAGASSKGPLRVRRNWTSLSPAERKRVIDAILALKRTSPTWAYKSFCEDPVIGSGGAYTKNAYDYFVELHMAAFVMTSATGVRATSTDMPHQGPQFLPWHREILRRFESELARVTGDSAFALPYWDWTSDPDSVFSTADLGGKGDCKEGTVDGYLADQGFRMNISTDALHGDVSTQASFVCSSKPLTRAAGCAEPPSNTLPTVGDIAYAQSIPHYDVPPYNTKADSAMSFRNYVEGFRVDAWSLQPQCALGGCAMHGRVHQWVGGAMSSGGGTPNDPLFFLHHANLDRLWAEWQDAHGNSSYPSSYDSRLFLFDGVKASDVFDHRKLGYRYDTQH
jgi:tyrosinase